MLLFGLAVVGAPSLYASMVRKMDLAGLCQRADKIFRGTVVGVTPGTVSVGGGRLPTVTYRLRVTEAFKGSYLTKDDASYAEITMIAPVKRAPMGDVRAFSKLPDLPELHDDQEYLLISTVPSAAGLSTTVGVGQGAFKIFVLDKTEMAVNELNNLGLYDGPVAYSRLAQDIRALVGQ
jgi:hypothetical protein